MTYIRSLDGLRALAILLVFIFHLYPNLVPGGFIGVDIFFVLSGFLITGILFSRSGSKGYYIEFLKGRVRRLVPAYALVITVCALISYFVLIPSETIIFSKSLLSSSVFLSNAFFYSKSGYFDGGTEFYPLLHTWSLAVEWQFYIVYPFLFFILRKHSRKIMLTTMVLITLISFAITYIVTNLDSSLAFYLTPFRVFEFTLGGIVYFLSSHRPQIQRSLTYRLIAAVSSGGLIFFALALDKNDLFPGVNALYVSLLTSILIYCLIMLEKNNGTNLYQSRVLVFIGKISYSLYLWHWPIIVFTKLYIGTGLEPMHYAFIIISTVALAFMSWYFVESKMRINTPKISKRALQTSFVTIALCAIFLVSSHTSNGFSWRVDQSLKALKTEKWRPFPGECEATQAVNKFYKCKIGDLSASPEIILLGDSHAQVVVWSMHEQLLQKGRSAVLLTKGGCPPILAGVPVKNSIEKDICIETQKKILSLIDATPNAKKIIIAARWRKYEATELEGSSTTYGIPKDMPFEERVELSLREILKKNKQVVLLDSFPEPDINVIEYLIRSDMNGIAYSSTYAYEPHSLKLNINQSLLVVLKPDQFFCKDAECMMVEDDEPLYFDGNHISKYAADKFVSQVLFAEQH